MHPAHRLYVGTIGEGLFRSLDGGATFARACNNMFVECHVRALAVHPRDDKTLYLGTEQGLFQSRDGAESWARVTSPLDGKQIWSILLSPHQPERMLVGTCPARFYLSKDAGQTWSEGRATLVQECPRIMHTRVTCFLADPADAGHFWAGVEIDGLFESLDGGRSWRAQGQGMSSRDIHALALVPAANGRPHLVAATNNDLNLSNDGGDTWQPLQIAKVMPWPYCRALAQPVDERRELLLGNGDAPPGSAGLIGRSRDGGLTWQPAAFPGRANSTVWNFAVHAADPSLIYAASVSGEVYRSTDRGASWDKLPREFGEIRALAWTPV